MPNLLRLKRGTGAVPTLQDGEPCWKSNTEELYIGKGGTGVLIGASDMLRKSGGTMTGFLTLHANPTDAMHAATKQYVDTFVQGLDFKGSVKVATTANISLFGTQTIDGIAVEVGDRVLVKNQTEAQHNGIYVVQSTSWVRASDADTSAKVTPGMFVIVERGVAYEDTGWLLITNAPIVLGTTELQFAKFPEVAVDAANRYLSNLQSPTAINQNLLPATTGMRDLGSYPTKGWRSLYIGYDPNDLQDYVTIQIAEADYPQNVLKIATPLPTSGERLISFPTIAGTLLVDNSTIDCGTF